MYDHKNTTARAQARAHTHTHNHSVTSTHPRPATTRTCNVANLASHLPLQDGRTPLHVTAQEWRMEAVAVLIAAKADVLVKDKV